MKSTFLLLVLLVLNVIAYSQTVVCNKSFNQHNASRKVILEDGEELIFEPNCYDTVRLKNTNGAYETKITERISGKPLLLNGTNIYHANDSDNLNFFIHADTTLNQIINVAEKEHDKLLPNGHYVFKLNNILVNEKGKIILHGDLTFSDDPVIAISDLKDISSVDFEKLKATIVDHIEIKLSQTSLPVLTLKGKKYPYLLSSNNHSFSLGRIHE